MIRRRQSGYVSWMLVAVIAGVQIGWFSLPAQNPSPEPQVSEIADAYAKSRAALRDYSWEQQEIIKVKDKIADQRLFQVQFGPDDRIEKIPLDLPETNSTTQRANPGLGEWVSQKKIHSLQVHVQELKELVEAYTQALPDSIGSAHARGDVTTEPSSGGAGRLLVRSFLKPGDSVMLVYDQKSSELQSFEVSSYIGQSKEPVLIAARFSKLEDVPNHIDEISAVHSKKKITLLIRNLYYRPK